MVGTGVGIVGSISVLSEGLPTKNTDLHTLGITLAFSRKLQKDVKTEKPLLTVI